MQNDTPGNTTRQSGAPPAYALDDLLYLMTRLRDPLDGCPWDLRQTYSTIVPSTIEEAYEVADAIARGQFEHLREELGDLLFQVIFYSQLAREEQRFDFGDVVAGLVTKLIRRHPHVFPAGTLHSRAGDQQVAELDVKAQWESLKQAERQQKGQGGVLEDVPLALPAMTRALKLQKRAAGTGFDRPTMDGVLDKIEEEIAELREAVGERDSDATEAEMGDLLFCLINAARHLQVDPETALRRTNHKFEQRFGFIERQLAEQGLSPDTASLEQMDVLWDEAKRQGL
jgi:ATP diphosphatase